MTTAILSRDALRSAAPSIFAATPYEKMSHRYKMVPTAEVLDILQERGFFPVKAVQSRSRIPGKSDFTRHMIRLRHSDFLQPLTVGSEIPELVLTNSHDGTAAYRFNSGVFRLVCINGLVVASADFGGISIKHSGGSDFNQRIIDATYEIIDQTPKTLATIETWKQLALPAPVQNAYAEAAHTLIENPNITPAQIIAPRRREDAPAPDGTRSLWTTFNAAQESIIKGGIQGRNANGRRTTTRPVKAVERDIKLNKALWTLAEKLAETIS
jgi:hypothetical protein